MADLHIGDVITLGNDPRKWRVIERLPDGWRLIPLHENERVDQFNASFGDYRIVESKV